MKCYRGFAHAGCVMGVAALAALSASCGDFVRRGQSPSFVILDAITAASGAKPDEFGHVLQSDVITNVRSGTDDVLVPTVFEDLGEATAHIALKDPGTPSSPNTPSAINEVTITRYRVVFKRSDGRNTPGIDVPYPFDGAVTATIGTNGATFNFVIVRAQAKMEGPLKALRGGGGNMLISTIAEVTFYGRDQAGNDVTASGQISVNFADWGDPQ
ncbi:MAG: hypothetical protein ACE148_11700 [Vicinamibacterales bacterium]